MKQLDRTLLRHVVFTTLATTLLSSLAGLPLANAEPQLAQIIFSKSYGVRKGTPIFWKGEKIGVVRDLQRATKANASGVNTPRDGEVEVDASLDAIPNAPERFVAVVTGMGHGKTNTTLRIELLPASSASDASRPKLSPLVGSSAADDSNEALPIPPQRIQGYGSFEELWQHPR